MEEPAVWETQQETVSAILIIALWTANGDHGSIGQRALPDVIKVEQGGGSFQNFQV